MGYQSESYQVVYAPGDNTGVGTVKVLLDKDGIHLYGDAQVFTNGAIARTPVTQQFDANAVDIAIWTATEGVWQVESVSETHTVAGGSGAQVDVKVCTGTQSPSQGTTQLGAVIDLTTAANTPKSPALIASPTHINPNDRVALDFGGTLTSLQGSITVNLKRIA